MANVVKRIGLLTSSPKPLIQLLETHFAKSSYHFCEIKFEAGHLNDSLGHFEDTVKAIEKISQDVDSMDVLIADGRLIPKVLQHIQKVKWVHLIWAGVEPVVDSLPIEYAPPMPITRFGGFFGKHMAEYTLSHIINFERSAFKHHNDQKVKHWETNLPEYRLISDLKFTILGCGDIGHTIGRHLKQFGGTVYGMVSSLKKTKKEYIDDYFTQTELPHFLEKSEYICNVLPSTLGTRNLLTPDLLKYCKNSVFINIGRGDIIKEELLLEALEKKWFRAAILDVFTVEPLPKESKLWTHPNVFITPHCSGMTQLREVVASFERQLKFFENGQSLEYVINLNKGY